MSGPTGVIVSPFFPPSTLAGVHRARHLVKHLPAAGWTPIILCVHEKYHEELLDDGLAAFVPDAADVFKTSALPARITRMVGVGDIGLRAWWSLRRNPLELLERRVVNVVMVTGSPFYPMLLGYNIKRRFGA